MRLEAFFCFLATRLGQLCNVTPPCSAGAIGPNLQPGVVTSAAGRRALRTFRKSIRRVDDLYTPDYSESVLISVLIRIWPGVVSEKASRISFPCAANDSEMICFLCCIDRPAKRNKTTPAWNSRCRKTARIDSSEKGKTSRLLMRVVPWRSGVVAPLIRHQENTAAIPQSAHKNRDTAAQRKRVLRLPG